MHAKNTKNENKTNKNKEEGKITILTLSKLLQPFYKNTLKNT